MQSNKKENNEGIFKKHLAHENNCYRQESSVGIKLLGESLKRHLYVFQENPIGNDIEGN